MRVLGFVLNIGFSGISSYPGADAAIVEDDDPGLHRGRFLAGISKRQSVCISMPERVPEQAGIAESADLWRGHRRAADQARMFAKIRQAIKRRVTSNWNKTTQ